MFIALAVLIQLVNVHVIVHDQSCLNYGHHHKDGNSVERNAIRYSITVNTARYTKITTPCAKAEDLSLV